MRAPWWNHADNTLILALKASVSGRISGDTPGSARSAPLGAGFGRTGAHSRCERVPCPGGNGRLIFSFGGSAKNQHKSKKYERAPVFAAAPQYRGGGRIQIHPPSREALRKKIMSHRAAGEAALSIEVKLRVTCATSSYTLHTQDFCALNRKQNKAKESKTVF